MYLRYLVFFAIASYTWQLTLCVEGRDNKGRHFIFGFMDNLLLGTLEVFITTDNLHSVGVTITTPLFDSTFSKTLSVNKNIISRVTFNLNIRGIGTELSNKGIDIQSDAEITVYAVNKEKVSTDAFVVFPIDALGDEYYILTWNVRSEFMIIATMDNTVVFITTGKGATPIIYKGVTYTAGMTLKIIMNRYESFHVFGGERTDFSGTYVKSNKVTTVMSGSQCSNIGGGACDHLCSQMTPVDTFGKRFVTMNMPNCNVPVDFKIVASSSNTHININGRAAVHMVTAGDVYTFQITDQTSRTIVADKPVALVFFAEGGCGSDQGDPAMILLPPIEQFAADYTFSTIKTPGNPFQNALTVVIPDTEINGLSLDGHPMTSYYWQQVHGSSTLQITNVNIADGPHTIFHSNPTVTFIAVSTGTAEFNSYGYIAGQRMALINSECNISKTVPGDIIDNDCDGLIDEELLDGTDNDGDGKIDEDLAVYFNDKDECASNPCLNGGTCSDEVNYYNCTCSPGYTGNNCQTDIDECASHPCMHEGICVDLVNLYSCICLHGYIGDNCQTDIDECASSPCQHTGHCVDLVNDYICHCSKGYRGYNCEIDINECVSNPCLNGGTCRDKVNSYVCTCQQGYVGKSCQTDVNECLSNPCYNNATCIDKAPGWSCSCLPGFFGKQCQTELDECESNPCRNNGTCIDKVNSYYCLCANESSGQHCEQKISHCLSSPCLNDGVCTNELYGYTCDCTKHWHGDKCEYEIINRTMDCVDIEYSECRCMVHQLKTKTPKSNKVLFGTVGCATGLLLTLISYCLSGMLNKPKTSNQISAEKNKSIMLEDNSTTPTEKEEVPKDKIKSSSEIRRKIPAHSSDTHNCFIDHTGFDFSQFCVNKDGSKRVPKCRHQKLINMKKS